VKKSEKKWKRAGIHYLPALYSHHFMSFRLDLDCFEWIKVDTWRRFI
jgi:hypothetical protein